MSGGGPTAAPATARIQPKKQTLEDAYSPPANFLEIDILDPQTHGVAKNRYTDYEVRMRVSVGVCPEVCCAILTKYFSVTCLNHNVSVVSQWWLS